MTDSLSVDIKEAKRFYDTHPELFIYDKWLWSGFMLSYTDWKWASSYYKAKESVFDSLVHEDFRLRK